MVYTYSVATQRGRRKLLIGSFIRWLVEKGGFKRTILLPFSLLLILSSGAYWYLYLTGSRAAVMDAADDLADSSAQRIAESVRSYLQLPTALVSSTADFAMIVRKGGGLESFFELLARSLDSSRDVEILALGFEDGEYVEAQRLEAGRIRNGRAGLATGGNLVLFFPGPAGEAPAASGTFPPGGQSVGPYDPRLRPWYSGAPRDGRRAWSEPYAYVSNGEVAMAAVSSFFDAAGAFAGVASATVSLGRFCARLEDLLSDSRGGAVVVDSRQRVVAAAFPGMPEVSLVPPLTALSSAEADGLGPLRRVLEAEGPHESFELAGRRWRGVRLPFEAASGIVWTIGVALPEDAFLPILQRTNRTVGFVFLVSLVALLLAAFVISSRVTDPLRRLGSLVDAIEADPERPSPARGSSPEGGLSPAGGAFPVGGAYDEAATGLSARQDEIGRLSVAFRELRARLQESFGSLRATIAEKDALLKEVHHRVKNNLQIVSSLVSLQEGESRGADAASLQARIHAMALVHETLYTSGSFASIDMRDYLTRLVAAVSRVYQDACYVESSVSGEGRLALDQAVPCGLVAAELIANAFKHAWPDRETGRLSLSFTCGSGNCVLSVSDDGVGYGGSSRRERGGMGSVLVEALADQLEGTLDVDSGPGGTVTTLRFGFTDAGPSSSRRPDR